jgi:hypothetical protein
MKRANQCISKKFKVTFGKLIMRYLNQIKRK